MTYGPQVLRLGAWSTHFTGGLPGGTAQQPEQPGARAGAVPELPAPEPRRQGWRDATEADHLAYHHWRRRDLRGPRVDGVTWSQEVSHLQQFSVHASSKSRISAVPIPQRARREWSGTKCRNRAGPAARPCPRPTPTTRAASASSGCPPRHIAAGATSAVGATDPTAGSAWGAHHGPHPGHCPDPALRPGEHQVSRGARRPGRSPQAQQPDPLPLTPGGPWRGRSRGQRSIPNPVHNLAKDVILDLERSVTRRPLRPRGGAFSGGLSGRRGGADRATSPWVVRGVPPRPSRPRRDGGRRLSALRPAAVVGSAPGPCLLLAPPLR